MIYSPIENAAGIWIIAGIEHFQTRQLTKSECEQACEILNSKPDAPMPDGGSAFPDRAGNLGMSLRDYFAAKAMQGVLASCPEGLRAQDIPPSTLAAWAAFTHRMADAMLKARGE